MHTRGIDAGLKGLFHMENHVTPLLLLLKNYPFLEENFPYLKFPYFVKVVIACVFCSDHRIYVM